MSDASDSGSPPSDSADSLAAGVRVLLVDDHPFVRDGVVGILHSTGRFRIVGEAATASEAIAALKALRPQLLITDLRLPEGDGIQVLRAAAEFKWGTYAVVLSAFTNDEDVLSAARAGARAYLLKTAPREELISALDRVLAGENLIEGQLPEKLRHRLAERDLTHRETQILAMIGRGLTNKQIAAGIAVSENTVKTHIKNLFRKIGASGRADAVSVAIHRGLVE